MRKKLTWFHSLIIFAALLILMIASLFCVNAVNRSNYENELRNYLSLSNEVLVLEETGKDDKTAIKDMAYAMTNRNSEIRITVIDMNGKVIYDTDRSEIETSHLDREEIKTLGKIVYRDSKTLNKKMMYLAALDSQEKYYIRVAIPLGNINGILRITILVSTITLIVVMVSSVIIDIFVIDRSLKPLKEDTRRLASIIGSDYVDTDGDDLTSISYQIDRTKDLIDEKIRFLTLEKEKLNFIINSMNQGLLILDEEKNVQLFNRASEEIFKAHIDENIQLTGITILPEVHDACKEALKGNPSTLDISVYNKQYLVNISPIQENWIRQGETKKGILMTLVDISDKKRLEDAKRDFFANASHELKSPLTSIIGYTEMIKDGFITEEKDVNEAEDRILSEAKRMNEIVKEMLDLSRLESEDPNKKIESLLILTKSRLIASQFEEELKKNSVEIEFLGDDFNIDMDTDDLNLLLKNLIENGIRYNKQGGKVVIRCDREHKILSISDTGIGIAKDNLNRIFERFYRVDKARSRKLGGTGLGLSIVKHICMNYSISIKVDSILDVGTTFTLSF